MKLHPYVAVITNIENDHMDYYKNMNNMKMPLKNSSIMLMKMDL